MLRCCIMDYAERRKAQAEQTEQTILHTALMLMRERGFDAVSVRDICRQAGITTGAFYHHFPSKEALLAKGFIPLEQYMSQALNGHEGEDISHRLWIILSTYGRYIEEECGESARRYYQDRLAGYKGALPLDPTRTIRTVLVDCFSQDPIVADPAQQWSPEWLADFCYCHFRGMVIDWLLHDRSYGLVQRMREHFDFLLHLAAIPD